MKAVIDLPERAYKEICSGNFETDGYFKRNLRDAFKNGTVLPEGHGDLKDMGNLRYMFDLTKESPTYSGKDIERAIKSMKTIIGADKESEEQKIKKQKEKGGY